MDNSPAPLEAQYRLSTSRRKLFGFGVAMVAAPSIVRMASIMPVSVPKPTLGKLLSADWNIVFEWSNGTALDIRFMVAELARAYEANYMLRDPQGMRVV